MDQLIAKLLRDNLEIEGALRVYADRRSPDALDIIEDKLSEFLVSWHSLKAQALTSDEKAEDADTIVKINEVPVEQLMEEASEVESKFVPVAEEVSTVPPQEEIVETVDDESTDYPQSDILETVTPSSIPAQYETRVEDIVARQNSKDLAKAFTINDKFRFIRGLFCDDRNDFEYTVAQLSSLDSLDEAYDYLLNDLGWDIDNDEVKEFISIINNHFNAL